jgi:hypothetical protein
MKERGSSTVFALISGITFISGIVLTLICLHNYTETKQHNAKREQDFNDLMKLERSAANLEAQLTPFRGIDYTMIPDTEKLVRNIFTKNEIEDIRQHSIGSVTGFDVSETEVALKDVELNKISGFVRVMESLRPPVHLTACEITASESRPGLGNVIFKLQSIKHAD